MHLLEDQGAGAQRDVGAELAAVAQRIGVELRLRNEVDARENLRDARREDRVVPLASLTREAAVKGLARARVRVRGWGLV